MSEESTQHLPNADLLMIRENLQSIDSRLSTVDDRLGTVEVRLSAVEDRFSLLEDRVDHRLQETRPIWESVLQQLKEIDARQSRIENENKDFRRMFRAEFSNLSRVQADIEERLDKIDPRPLPQ